MSETPTWDKITSPVGSTTSEFGGIWANLLSDYFNGVNIILSDASKAPIIGTLTRFKPDKLGIYDTDQSHYVVIAPDDIDTGPVRKFKIRRMNTPFEEDYAVLEGMPQTLLNKTIDADLNTVIDIANASIKTGAAIAYSKLNLSNSISNSDINSAAAIPYSKLNLSNSIVAGDITSNAVTTAKILDANVTLAKLASDSVDSSKIVAGSIVDSDVNASAGIVTTKLADSANFVLTTRTNSFGDFNQVFKDNRLLINNPADTFAYTIIGAAIAANRNITLPLLAGNDVIVTEAFAQTLTNKTLAAGSNTITGIVDANITAHTTTKITTTAKGQLNSAIVYNDQTNTFGDFDQILRDNRLRINNPADTFAYTIIAAAIAANRNVTLPLLTGDDIFVTAAFAQTLTNKSIDADTNTLTNIENADIKASAGIVTTKLADSANFILKTLDNSFGAHYQDFTKMTAPTNPGVNDIRLYVDTTDTHLKIRNNAGTVVDLHTGGGGGATNLDGLTDVDLTTDPPDNGDVLTYTTTGTKWIPLPAPGAGGGITASSADTLTNKSINADNNTITNIDNNEIKAAAGIVTSKLADSANFVLVNQANTFGAFNQTFPTSRLLIGDSDASHAYLIAGSNIVANRTVTLPLLTGNDIFVTEAFTQTLTNKTLTTPVISSISNSGTITIPTGTDILVGKATTDVFTNKSFNADGTGNSITNIENADIKAAAGIVTSKLADSANFLLSTLDNSFGAHYHDITKMTAPGNPGANDIRIYVDTTDTHLKIRNNAGTIVDLHSAGGGGTVTASSTDTFTNKTIDADGAGNVISNIENADIKASAGIVTSKLADSANFLLKTLDNSFGAHYYDVTKMTAPSNPSANDIRVYVDTTDTHLKIKNNAGTVVDLHNAGSGTSVVEPHSYYIYRTGSTYFAQAGDNITPVLTSNSDFVTLISGVINGVTAGTPLKIKLGAGDFIIQSAWTIPQSRLGNITIDGQGMGKTRLLLGTTGLNAAAAGTVALTIGSDLTIAAGNTGTLTSNTTVRGRTCVMSTGDGNKFATDDFVLIKSNKVWTSPATGSSIAKQGEIKQIFQTPATGTVTFDVPLYDTYTTANTALLYKLSMIKNITLSNLTITNEATLTNNGLIFLNIKYCFNLTINNVEIIDNKASYDSGIVLWSCINAKITGCNLIQNPSNTHNLQYGITLKGSCQNCVIDSSTSCGRFRHAFEMCGGLGSPFADNYAGICRNNTFSNCVAIGSEIAAFDTHEDGEMNTFANCKVLGTYSEYGFQIKAKRTKLLGCSVNSASTLGYIFYEDAHESQLIDCDATNCGWYGVRIVGQVKNIQIIGGLFSNNNDWGIYVGLNCDYVTITGATIKNNISGAILIETASNFSLIGNTISGNPNFGIYVDPAGGTTPTNFIVTGNHLEGQSNAPLTLVPPVSEVTNFVHDNMGLTNVGLPLKTAYRAVSTTPVTLSVATDQLVKVDASGGARTVNLPAVSGNSGLFYTIIKSDSSANNVTIDGNASETINGATTYLLTAQYQSVVLRCDGAAWFTQVNTSERTGTATATANGSTTVFNIAHGLGSTPYRALVECSTHTGTFTRTEDATNIVVTYGTAPPGSPATIKFHWSAVL